MLLSANGEESNPHEMNVEAAMAKSGGSPGPSAMRADDLQKGSSSGLRNGQKDSRLRKGPKDTRLLTCGNGQVGNGTCPNEGECCSQYGWCGTSAEHCGGSPEGGSTSKDGAIGRSYDDWCWLESYCYGEACDSCCYGWYWYYDYYWGSWDQYCY